MCSSDLEAGHIDIESVEFNLEDLIEKTCEVTVMRAHNKGIEFARAVPGIEGILIIVGNKMGLWGKVRISEIASHSETG